MLRVFLPTCAAAVLCVLAVLGPVRAGGGSPIAQADKSLAGQFLVATETLRDPRFARTVIYLIRHDAGGAQGFVVNRPLGEIALAKLLEQMHMDASSASGQIRLHGGGPVEGRRVFVLHTSDYSGTGTTQVKDGVSVTSDPDILQSIAAGKGPRRLRLIAGYAGWGAGQLDSEIEEEAWIVVPPDAAPSSRASSAGASARRRSASASGTDQTMETWSPGSGSSASTAPPRPAPWNHCSATLRCGRAQAKFATTAI